MKTVSKIETLIDQKMLTEFSTIDWNDDEKNKDNVRFNDAGELVHSPFYIRPLLYLSIKEEQKYTPKDVLAAETALLRHLRNPSAEMVPHFMQNSMLLKKICENNEQISAAIGLLLLAHGNCKEDTAENNLLEYIWAKMESDSTKKIKSTLFIVRAIHLLKDKLNPQSVDKEYPALLKMIRKLLGESYSLSSIDNLLIDLYGALGFSKSNIQNALTCYKYNHQRILLPAGSEDKRLLKTENILLYFFLGEKPDAQLRKDVPGTIGEVFVINSSMLDEAILTVNHELNEVLQAAGVFIDTKKKCVMTQESNDDIKRNNQFETALKSFDFERANRLMREGANIKLMDLAYLYRVGNRKLLELSENFKQLINARIYAGMTQDEKDNILNIMAEAGFVESSRLLIVNGAKATKVNLSIVYNALEKIYFSGYDRKYVKEFMDDLVAAGASTKGFSDFISTKSNLSNEEKASYKKLCNESSANPNELRFKQALEIGDFHVMGQLIDEGMSLKNDYLLSQWIDGWVRKNLFSYSDFLLFLKKYISAIHHKDQLLGFMVQKGYVEAAEILLAAGAKANDVRLLAVLKNPSHNIGLIKALLEAGAVNERSGALQFAITHELHEIRDLLLKNCFPDKVAALHDAVIRGFSESTALLMQHGADPKSIQLEDAFYPGYCDNKRKEIEPTLLDQLIACATFEQILNAFESALTHFTVKEVNRLLKAGVQPNGRARDGMTYLFKALQYYNLPIVVALINAGADVNAASTERSSTSVPLLQACNTKERMEVLYLLYVKGADLNAPIASDNFHGTVLQWVSSHKDFYIPNITELLTLWSEIEKCMKQEGILPKKRIEAALNLFIKQYTPSSSYFGSLMGAAASLPASVKTATAFKKDVLSLSANNGEAFVKAFDTLVSTYQSKDLMPGTLDSEQKNLAAICERIAYDLRNELRIAQSVDNDKFEAVPNRGGEGTEMKRL